MGEVCRHPVGNSPLMHRVRVAVQKTDGHRLIIAFCDRSRQSFGELVFGYGFDHGTIWADPFIDFEGMLATYYRYGLSVEQIVDLSPIVPLQHQQIPKPFGD